MTVNGPIPERSYFNDSLTKQQARQDLKILETALVQAHPGLDLYESRQDFESQLIELERSLPDKIALTCFLERLSRLVASVRCGHTGIGLSENQMQTINRMETYFPLPVKIIGSRAWIDLDVRIDGKSLLGSEIASINGIQARDLIERLSSLVTTDGNNRTLPLTYLEDHFYLYYLLFAGPSTQFNLLLRPNGADSSSSGLSSESDRSSGQARIGNGLTHFTIGSASRQTVIDNYHRRASLSVFYGQTGPGKRADQTSLTLLKDHKTAILTLASFDNDELKEQKIRLKRFLKESFESLAANRISSLILDIRHNTGGDEGNEDLLLSYLVDKPYRKYESVRINTPEYSFLSHTDLARERKARKFRKSLKKEFIPDSNRTYRRKEGFFKPVRLHKPTFRGDVYVLIGGRVFSGSSEFATLLDQNRKAVFIGEESGGNYYGNTSGEYLTVNLPNSGFELTVPLCLYELSVHKLSVNEVSVNKANRMRDSTRLGKNQAQQGNTAGSNTVSSNTMGSKPDDGLSPGRISPRDHGLIPDHKVCQTLSDSKNGKDTLIDYTLKLIRTKR